MKVPLRRLLQGAMAASQSFPACSGSRGIPARRLWGLGLALLSWGAGIQGYVSQGAGGLAGGGRGRSQGQAAGRGTGRGLFMAEGFWEADDADGDRVEESLKLRSRALNAFGSIIFERENALPAPSEPPQFPPARVELGPPSREASEQDREAIHAINTQYYEHLNERDVSSLLKLWCSEGDVQLYCNEDNVIKG
jgi:hypothetical protein